MSHIRIESKEGAADTRIFIDDAEMKDVSAYELRARADGGLPVLVLFVNATVIDVDVVGDVVQRHPNAIDDAQTSHAFELVNQPRVVQAIGDHADVTEGVNIPRMALSYVALPHDVRLDILLTLGLITRDEADAADRDDTVRHKLEKDALGRAIDGACISALDKAVTAAYRAAKQQGEQA